MLSEQPEPMQQLLYHPLPSECTPQHQMLLLLLPVVPEEPVQPLYLSCKEKVCVFVSERTHSKWMVCSTLLSFLSTEVKCWNHRIQPSGSRICWGVICHKAAPPWWRMPHKDKQRARSWPGTVCTNPRLPATVLQTLCLYQQHNSCFQMRTQKGISTCWFDAKMFYIMCTLC